MKYQTNESEYDMNETKLKLTCYYIESEIDSFERFSGGLGVVRLLLTKRT